jgi:hypothetical protein
MSFDHAKRELISLDLRYSRMGIDQKVRYAMLALAAASMILAALGLHSGAHMGVLDGGGVADRAFNGLAR